ncbi:MAG TPA: aspartate--tRNA ligase [Acidimicrobiales bacterium]|nr:aspartate--tRNA ligase [Acidimicrobiales bacterium]
MLRTDYCGALRADDAGRRVSVCGWVAHRREHGEHLSFIDLRDYTGIVQCVVDGAVDARPEWVLRITGTVAARPEGTENPDLPTGAVELRDCDVEVLSKAEPPPFQLDSRVPVDETTRLRYRYVDLRRDRMQRNLRLRARVNSAIRASMEAQGFLEIETPLLIASTPEGARDFLVPSRLQPGKFYALPQSPQILKQLCMVGGCDRYFQLARCLRDEDLRADRQFEFTQLDAEMSFAGQEDVLAAITAAVAAAATAATGEPVDEFATMTWQEAQERYGSDKPDTRFGMELVDVTHVFTSTEFKAFAGAETVKGIVVPGSADLPRNRLDALTDAAKRWGAKGLVWMRVRAEAELESPVAKFLSETEVRGLVGALGAAPGDLILLVADARATTRHVLGLLRLELGRPPVNEGGLHFLWVTQFPLFEALDEEGRPIPAHHPFTMPVEEDFAILESDPLAVRSQAYDLVLNGWELGSGSVRIHRPDIQQRIFSLLGISPDEAQRRFGFLLDAFRYGAPPHAGFAFGIDRLVALLAGEENIREVIAFPKTQSGVDPLMGSPTPVDAAELAQLGLRALPPPG